MMSKANSVTPWNEASVVEEGSPSSPDSRRSNRKQSMAKLRHVNTLFETLTCCLPKWMQYFIVNVYRANVPETIWFEDVGMLPHFTRNLAIFCYNLSYICIFIYFVISAYSDNRKTYFISLEADAGECEEIGRPTTGQFLIGTGVNFSSYAYETAPDFTYNTSSYMLTLDSYQSKFVAQILARRASHVSFLTFTVFFFFPF
jgi:hypothetical protein